MARSECAEGQEVTDKPASKDPILRALHEARKAQGLTLLDVAERMGRMTSQSPCHWENGNRSPSLVNLHEWAGALGYELALKPRAVRP
jgi:transcriptional regulator with XRE-family HTH domain